MANIYTYMIATAIIMDTHLIEGLVFTGTDFQVLHAVAGGVAPLYGTRAEHEQTAGCGYDMNPVKNRPVAPS